MWTTAAAAVRRGGDALPVHFRSVGACVCVCPCRVESSSDSLHLEIASIYIDNSTWEIRPRALNRGEGTTTDHSAIYLVI